MHRYIIYLQTLALGKKLMVSNAVVATYIYIYILPPLTVIDCLCGLVIRFPGYRSRGPGSIPCATRFSEKYWIWNRVHSAS
jgi:hypothetical protein